MKFVFYNDFLFGAVVGAQIIDLTHILVNAPGSSPQELLTHVIKGFPSYKEIFEGAIIDTPGIPIEQVKIRLPVPKPTNIVAMAVNYMEDGTRAEPAPINAFHKSSNSLIGSGDTMVLPDVPATIFEGEAELALVIGKQANNVKAKDAYEHIFGYVNFIDGSARGLPPDSNSFYQMKSRDTFGPIGPWLVTADEIPDPQNLEVKLWVNDRLTQNYNTSDMAHKIPRIIEWVSSIHTLEVGDIVSTGTNHRGLHPFQDNDVVKLEIAPLGILHISVRDDLKREWAPETRLERTEKGLDGTTPQLSGRYSGS